MTIKVNFRVVGMYLGTNLINDPGAVVVEVPEGPTVFEIMKAVAKMARAGAIDGVDLFSFTPTAPWVGEDLSSISINFIRQPKKNRPYKAGLYVLSDNLETNPITTFQYYIHNTKFEQVNINNKSKRFSEKPDVEIKDGYTVIIRQVAILVDSIPESYLAKTRAQNASDALTS